MKIVIAWIVTISLPFVCSEKEALVEWERNSNDQNHMVVSTIDGKVYFVDQETGQIQWEFSTGTALIQSSTPLESELSSPYALVPSIDGTLLFMSQNSDLMEKSSLTAKELVEQSPFLARDGVIYRGHKATRIYGMDVTTGNIVYAVDKAAAEIGHKTVVDPLVISRTDYFVQALNGRTGEQEFNFTYGEVLVVSDRFNTKIDASTEYIVDDRGTLARVSSTGSEIWSQRFQSPVATNTFQTKNGWKQGLIRQMGSAATPQVYVGKLKNEQQYAVTFDSNLALLPRPSVAAEIEFDQATQMEYKVCRDLSDFECLVQFHSRSGRQDATCPDERRINLKAQPSLISVLSVVTVFLFLLVVVLIYVVLRRRKRPYRPVDKTAFRDPEGNLHLGSIKVSDQVLGYGGHGTVVYSGWLGSREIAVKRLLKQFHSNAENEMKLLINSDGHPNVVRYYAKEESEEFIYLALEKCKESLADALSGDRKGHSAILAKRKRKYLDFFKELANGVAHLHTLRILHRDLKPHNILLAHEGMDGIAFGHPKVSDMGLGKQLDGGESSFGKISDRAGIPLTRHQQHSTSSSAVHAPGSVGWQAPELLAIKGGHEDLTAHSARKTAAVDVFSLGCIFYNVFLPGSHPFGEWFERERNILLGKSDVADLIDLPEAQDLIRWMIEPNPLDRPTMTQVLDHPFFWNEERALTFLLDVSDRVEKEDRRSRISEALEQRARSVIGQSWTNKLPSGLLVEMEQFRKYQARSVRDCLRLIRNKRHHYHDLPESIQESLGPVPVGFYYYFSKRFPRLVMHCYKWAVEYCGHERLFESYLGTCVGRYAVAVSPSNKNDSRGDGWHHTKASWVRVKSEVKQSSRYEFENPSENKLRTGVCAFWKDSLGVECKYGDRCTYAHGFVEYRIPASLRDIPWHKNGRIIDLLGVDGRNDVNFQSIQNTNVTQNYKTKVCRFFIGPLGCSNGENCRFLHPGIDTDTQVIHEEKKSASSQDSNWRKK